MLFDGNRIIRIKSELLGSDLLHAEESRPIGLLFSVQWWWYSA